MLGLHIKTSSGVGKGRYAFSMYKLNVLLRIRSTWKITSYNSCCFKTQTLPGSTTSKFGQPSFKNCEENDRCFCTSPIIIRLQSARTFHTKNSGNYQIDFDLKFAEPVLADPDLNIYFQPWNQHE